MRIHVIHRYSMNDPFPIANCTIATIALICSTIYCFSSSGPGARGLQRRFQSSYRTFSVKGRFWQNTLLFLDVVFIDHHNKLAKVIQEHKRQFLRSLQT